MNDSINLSRSQNYQRLKQLLQKTMVLPPEQREPFVRKAVGDDHSLGDEVLAILKDESADVISTRPELTPGVAKSTLEVQPESIGPFQIIEKLGEGGMGVVFRARQEQPLKREVALKIINLSHHQGSRERFLKECQALARLSHTNVATLYSSDTTVDGLPYAVMELVEGLPITEYCDTHQMTVRERIQLFCRVCDGVSHAHEKNILHCDIKPSNVLVTTSQGWPLAKVIDFGLARALEEDSDLAKTRGNAFGSPAYLSPERITSNKNWQPDTRTDVYALGILLHELLVGVHPFNDGDISMAGLVAKLAMEDPQRPSSLWRKLKEDKKKEQAALRNYKSAEHGRLLKGDLDAILLKALARKPAQRYSTPSSLKADLMRYQRHIPVKARPASTKYILGRYLRRNWVAIGFSFTVAALLVAGIITTTQQAIRANQETQRAQLALAESDEVTNFLIDLFGQADPQRLNNGDISVVDLLDQASERIETEFDQQPLRKGRLMSTIGGTYQRMGRYDRAKELLEKSLLLLETEQDSDILVINTLDALGIVHRRQEAFDKAEQVAKRSLELARNQPDELLIARSLNTLGNFYFSRQKLDQALPIYKEMLDIRERLLGPNHLDTAMANNNIGSVLLTQGQVDEAARYYQRLMEIVEKELAPGHPWRSIALRNMGAVVSRKHKFEQSVELFRRVLAEQHERFEDSSQEIQATKIVLSNELRKLGQFEEAMALLKEVLKSRQQQNGPEHTQVANILRRMGSIALANGHTVESIQLFKQAFILRDKSLGASHKLTLEAQAYQVDALIQEGNTSEALQILANVQSTINEPDKASEQMMTFKRQRAVLDRLEGRLDQSETQLRQLIEQHEPEKPSVTWNEVYYELGLTLSALKRYKEAEAMLQTALNRWTEQLSNRSDRVGRALFAIAQTLEYRQQFEQARKTYEQALLVGRQIFPQGHGFISKVESALSIVATYTESATQN